MIVNKSVAPIYTKCPLSELTPLADEIPCGWRVDILDESGEYFHVNAEYGYDGWMRKSDLSDDVLPDYEVVSRFCDIVPTEEYNFKPIATLPMQARLKMIRSGEKWSEVILPGGLHGYVRTMHISPVHSIFAPDGYASVIREEAELRKKIVNSAEKYLDTPYRWGGKSSFGIDCSGLCFMAYYENGIALYRDAEPDTKYTHRIPIEEARPGDLLYFPGHIAMVKEGRRIVHSSSALSMVGYNSLDPADSDYNDYLKSILITAATVFSK